DTDGAEEAERVGAERRATRQRPARAPEAELIAHGRVHEEIAERVAETQAEGDGLAVGAKDLDALGHLPAPLEDPPLEWRGMAGPRKSRARRAAVAGGRARVPAPGRRRRTLAIHGDR